MKKQIKNFIRQKQMRSETVSTLLKCIASGIDTKRKIMSATGFSWGSVATYVTELLDAGVICECDNSGTLPNDRRSSHYCLARDEYYALGVDIASTGISFSLMAADGTLLENHSVVIAKIDNDNLCEYISRAYGEFLTVSKFDNDKILVTVCALTGAVDSANLIWLFSPHHPEVKNCDLSCLRDVFPGKLKIEHDIFSKARSIFFHYHIEDANSVFIHVGDGIGLAAYSESKFFTGKRGFSGEIGHVPFPDNAALRCRCGKMGCLECSLSLKALEEHGVEALDKPFEFLCVTAVNLFDPEYLVIGGEAVENMLFSLPEKWNERIKNSSWMNAPEKALFYRMCDCLTSYGAALGCRDELIDFITCHVCR